jgi:ribosomal protein S12 methylthiotransferase
VCRYLDIPLQHASGAVLKAMRRGVTRAGQERILQRVRDRVPDVAVRTTFIVGFPGETDADFEELCDFVRQQRFDHVGVFTFFQEDGVDASALEGQVPEDVKNERQQFLMDLQRQISRERHAGRIGQVMPVLVEGRAEESELLLRGRLEIQAPDVDGQVYIASAPADVAVGQIRQVRITQAGDYDLVGELA